VRQGQPGTKQAALPEPPVRSCPTWDKGTGSDSQYQMGEVFIFSDFASLDFSQVVKEELCRKQQLFLPSKKASH